MLALRVLRAASVPTELDHQARLVDAAGGAILGLASLRVVLPAEPDGSAADLGTLGLGTVGAEGGEVGTTQSLDTDMRRGGEPWVE